MKEEVCCPRVEVEKWDNKELVWKDKKFVKTKVRTFMYMPMNFGKVITKTMKSIEESSAKVEDNLCLSDHTSKWNMDILLAVDKEVKGLENITLSGKFYSKVYEGEFNKTKEWSEDFESNIDKKGFKIKKLYMWYTTCPKCAKKYGKNYVVIIAEV